MRAFALIELSSGGGSAPKRSYDSNCSSLGAGTKVVCMEFALCKSNPLVVCLIGHPSLVRPSTISIVCCLDACIANCSNLQSWLARDGRKLGASMILVAPKLGIVRRTCYQLLLLGIAQLEAVCQLAGATN